MYTPRPVNPRPLPEFVTREDRETLASIQSRVATNIRRTAKSKHSRPGFGTVNAAGPLHRSQLMLSTWGWCRASPALYPGGIDRHRFVDDPIGVEAQTCLEHRLRIAEEFATVANDIFRGDDVVFSSRAIEIDAASPTRPAGFSRKPDGDLMVIDLFEGEPMPRIIDRLLRDEIDQVRKGDCFGKADFHLRLHLWNRAERINAARRMLGLDLPPIRVPGLAALNRRILEFTGSEWGCKASAGGGGPPAPPS